MTLPPPELVALEGGPMRGQWFTRNDLNARQQTARYMLNRCPSTPPVAVAILNYHDTGLTTTRRIGRATDKVERIATATIWTYQETQP